MNEGLYFACILLIYFALGALSFLRINKDKDRRSAAQNWIKYLTYFGIIFSMFLIIFYLTSYFRYLCLGIILTGVFEIVRLELKTKPPKKLFFFIVMISYSILSWLFYSFSLLDKSILLVTFFTVSSFDAFSQITGQMFGKRKIIPGISPNKTVGGFIGGVFLASLTALLIGNILMLGLTTSLLWGICISIFAFIGDIVASGVKRKYNVKDYSHLIPGHGGFLDRFDSLIFAGAMVFLFTELI